ncbi:DeoR/GlpR family DNA-binding transcription regulator [Metabacillus iocasae]|uniref:DeoR/GlpR family transcriptional regulator of sugar metabolism n=1 Tax=Priestia iocasae TaxID=2291674 RepID=A0ABS2QU14_9BACI|nr:DeoR/GlpR family DNA-binding transcription regulator [Metabacillus iocasae]MBM7702788.1 DeoR/GlpR family transcriptional regulator of sugar metabolism [Metabacillus iocasae]
MYQDERLLFILDFLTKHRRITVDQICSFYDVSRDTARRDLVKLEEQKKIIRTRGGALLPAAHNEVKGYQTRLQTASTEKKQIGQKAASLIQHDDRIILDSSTTVQACAELMEDEPCTVITNSIYQADILSSKNKIRIQLLGGELEKDHRFLYGESVIERLSHYHVDKLFLGVVGISENGLTIAHEEDGMVKRKMIKQAKQVIVLADYTKLGVTDFYRFASLEDIDLLITDQTPPKKFRNLLNKHSVDLLIANDDIEEDD